MITMAQCIATNFMLVVASVTGTSAMLCSVTTRSTTFGKDVLRFSSQEDGIVNALSKTSTYHISSLKSNNDNATGFLLVKTGHGGRACYSEIGKLQNLVK